MTKTSKSVKKQKRDDTRELGDLVSVGPATIRDFKLLGISTVEQLTKHDARELYDRLCEVTSVRHDPCCEDVFSAAIAQAKNRNLPAEKCNWWYWSAVRKSR